MNRLLLTLLWLLAIAAPLSAQTGKLSPYVREVLHATGRGQSTDGDGSALSVRPRQAEGRSPVLTAFVKATDDKALTAHGCRILAQWGDLYIAAIPLSHIEGLAREKAVSRIEASRPMTVSNDTCAHLLGTEKVWQGEALPQPFTGKGVVVGIQDIGFDFTHPTFDGRIRRFWDHLTTDTVGSRMYAGRDYVTADEIRALGHSFDGLQETHGTHTAGSAAGSGYQSKYRGMAPESDIVMIANATGNNVNLIDSADLYRYTNALDVLGFQYAFDYAQSQGKPCVVSFSEGASDDLYESNLFFEALEAITGPGRILVASAGNKGHYKTWLPKPASVKSVSGRMTGNDGQLLYFVRSRGPIVNRFPMDDGLTYSIPTNRIAAQPDSILYDTLRCAGQTIPICMALYPSCWDPTQLVHEVYAETSSLRFEIAATDTEAELFPYLGTLQSDEARNACSIQVPSAAPAVISVGAVGYRSHIINHQGQRKAYQQETGGRRSDFSSIGPSLRGDVKPDIMAPGNNVISSYSSWYLESHPQAADIGWDVEHFDCNGRTYAWNSNSGTSMSAPIAAGIIALWLEANPRLTKADILDVFAHTARHTAADADLGHPTYPNNYYGYGEIDAYHGLLYILGLSGIVTSRPVSPSLLPLRPGERMAIYTAGGTLEGEFTDADAQPDASRLAQSLPQGIHAIQITSPDPTRCGSMLIRGQQ